MKNFGKLICTAVFAAALFCVTAIPSYATEKLPAPAVKTETVSSQSIKVSWNKVDGAEKYTLYIRKDNTSGFKLLGNTAKTSYTVSKLDSAKKYKFKVTPIDITKGKTTAGVQSEAVSGVTGGYYVKSYILSGTKWASPYHVKNTYKYDENGNRISGEFYSESASNKEQSSQILTYDKNGNLLSSTDSTDITEYKTIYKYDGNDNLISVASESSRGRVIQDTYTYDTKGNQISHTPYLDGVLGATEHRTYDSKGNVLTVRYGDNPVALTYTYDAKGNLVSTLNSDGGKETYTYDSKGNLLTEKDYWGRTYTYTYDASGNVLTYTMPVSGDYTDEKLVYTYDDKGNKLTELQYHKDGTRVENYSCKYTYDDKGNMLTIDELNSSGHYTAVYTYDDTF